MIWWLLLALSCTIRSDGFDYGLLYDINLRATHTTIPSTRGVEIPISLVSSATDSIWQCIVVFKDCAVFDSDPKSEFLYQSSHITPNRQTSPWTTSYVSQCPAHSTYLWLTHKPWASYGHALGLLDWRLVIWMTVWEPRSNLGASYCNITVLVASWGLSDQSA